MEAKKEIIIEPESAEAFAVKQGEAVRITDTDGAQPGDFIAFDADTFSISFSQSRTRVENGVYRVTAGNTLWTDTQPPEIMFTVTEDTFGYHDLLYTPCCSYALEKRFNRAGKGCLENLAEALEPFDINIDEIPDPLNLFFCVEADTEGTMRTGTRYSKPGDYIELRAEMDCMIAVSTCPVQIKGTVPSPYMVEIFS
jgi:uncharacterized protein YcgI (DUF1989 family)